jgi:hypothetical protein
MNCLKSFATASIRFVAATPGIVDDFDGRAVDILFHQGIEPVE